MYNSQVGGKPLKVGVSNVNILKSQVSRAWSRGREAHEEAIAGSSE